MIRPSCHSCSGALAAASGRLLLAIASRHLRGRFSPARLESLAAARAVLTGDPRKTAGGLALFARSPVASAQLFVAAGLLAVPLLPPTAAFFAGRLVSYSLCVGGATLAADRLGDTFTGVFTSPLGIAAQVAMLMALVALVRVDWAKRLQQLRGAASGPPLLSRRPNRPNHHITETRPTPSREPTDNNDPGTQDPSQAEAESARRVLQNQIS